MARTWTPIDGFPYRALRYSGILFIFLGLACMCVALADVIYTASRFGSGCDAVDFLDWQFQNPCNHDDLIWTWVSSGIWGGVLILFTGIVGLSVRYRNMDLLRNLRDAYGIMVTIIIIVIGPAIIVLNALEIYNGVDIFYDWDDDNSFVTEDDAKFILPVVVASIAFVAWINAFVTSIYICCCAHFVLDGYDYKVNSWMNSNPDYYRRRRPRRIDNNPYLDPYSGSGYSGPPKLCPYPSAVVTTLAPQPTAMLTNSNMSLASIPSLGPYRSSYGGLMPVTYGSPWG